MTQQKTRSSAWSRLSALIQIVVFGSIFLFACCITSGTNHMLWPQSECQSLQWDFPLRVSMTTVCLALCLLAFATHMPLCFWPSFSSRYKRQLTCVSVCKQGPCAFKHFYLCLPWPFIHVFAFGKVWFWSFSLLWQTHNINWINWSSSECLLNIGFMFHHFQLQCHANADFILGFIPDRKSVV